MTDTTNTTGIIHPTPITEFANSKLKESIAIALADVRPDHGNAVLKIDNKGGGLMLVQRFGNTWAVVLAGRYDFDTRKPEVEAAVTASW